MILFEEKKGSNGTITCRVTEWKAAWQNSELAVYAESVKDKSCVFIQKISNNGFASSGIPLDTKNKLESETEYLFFVLLCQSGGETRLTDDQLGGKTTYRLPYVAHITYYVEELDSSWVRVGITVNGSLPRDSIRVQTGKRKYALPYSPKPNKIYSFRVRIKGSKGEIKIVSSVNISNPIEKVATLSRLKDKAMEE